MKRLLFVLLTGICPSLFGQSLDVDQTSQFLKPRLRFDGRYYSTFNKSAVSIRFYESQVLVSAPINTKVTSNLKDLLSGENDLKNIKDIKIRFSQQMISARVGYRHLEIDTASKFGKDVYSGGIGLFGIQSLKKLNILFYALNANFAESSQSLEKLKPGFSGIIGNVKLKGLKKYFVYGLFAGYIGNRFVACPFFGANLQLKPHHYFNFVLPAYIGYNYTDGKVNNTLALGLEGFRTGIYNNLEQYANMNFGALSLYDSFRYKIRKGFWIRIDAGLISRGALRFTNDESKIKFNINPGYYFTGGLHYNFGASALKQINLLDLL